MLVTPSKAPQGHKNSMYDVMRGTYDRSSIASTFAENRTAFRGVVGLVLSLAEDVKELARPSEEGKLRGR